MRVSTAAWMAAAASLGGASAFMVPVPMNSAIGAQPRTSARRMTSSGWAGKHRISVGRRRAPAALAVAASPVPSLRMLVEPKGEDSFREIEEEVESSPLRATVGKLTPVMAKTIVQVIVPAASVVGYLATPTSKVAISAIGAALSGVGGNWARQKITKARKESAPAQVARTLEEKGMGDTTPEELKEILASYGLEGQAAEDVLVQIYSKYLVAMCQNSMAKTSEIKELGVFRETLGLDGLLLGEAHYQAASPIYTKYVLPTPSAELADEWSPSRRALDKFLFLCDRMFEACDTEEAYVYEMDRIGKVFGLSTKEVKERTSNVATPFYEKALASAIAKWKTVKPEALERARKTLGLHSETAGRLNYKAYLNEAKDIVSQGEEGPVVTAEAMTRLQALGSLLGVEKGKAKTMFYAVIKPIYQKRLVEVLKGLMEDTEEKIDSAALSVTYSTLMTLMGNLQLDGETADSMMRATVCTTCNRLLEVAAQFARVANEGETGKATDALLRFANSVLALVSMDAFDGSPEAIRAYQKVIGGDVTTLKSRGDTTTVYQMHLKRTLQGEMNEEKATSLTVLARLLGVHEVAQMKAYREASGPQVEKCLKGSVEECMKAGEFTTEQREKKDKRIKDLTVPQLIVNEKAEELYEDVLQRWGGRGKFLSEVDKQTLDDIRDFLYLDQTVVNDMHYRICGATYQKAVSEGMGATGVISPEYREKLRAVSASMGLTSEYERQMFGQAVRDRMKLMMEQVVYEFERTVLTKEQMAQKRGTDVGTDYLASGKPEGELGIMEDASVTSEVLALVDFYTDNGVIEEDDKGQMVFPVTAQGMANDKILLGIYQNFVVAAFSAQGTKEIVRYEGAQSKLAGILGLDAGEVNKVHQDIGSQVVNRFVAQELTKGGKLEAQAMAFLANVQNRLKMPAEEFEKLVKKAKVVFVRSRASNLFFKEKVSPETSKGLRDLASACDVDLATEGCVDKRESRSLFKTEIEGAIEEEKLEGEQGRELIDELTESLSISKDDAQEYLEQVLEGRAKRLVDELRNASIQGHDQRIITNAESLLKYCRLAGGLTAESVHLERDQQEIIMNVYKAKVEGSIEEGAEGAEEAEVAIKEDLALLRMAIGMK